MIGRNGNDQFSRFTLIVSLVLLVLSWIFNDGFLGSVLWAMALAALIYTYFRMFSRNLQKRREENARYLEFSYKHKRERAAKKERYAMRKDYCFFKCPSCKAMLRVPRGKGKILVRCSKCGQSFERKT